jgi:hypothetical protein
MDMVEWMTVRHIAGVPYVQRDEVEAEIKKLQAEAKSREHVCENCKRYLGCDTRPRDTCKEFEFR